ncbi:hypothetical protein CWI42_121100 [Ordospora colligata]|uniref:Kinetochore protein SPC25 n=1 Tax=Ordospora colligata OC4 TaxID=1354746 RepID=A0A0B2UHS6_9MICR|nr:uncharacterized protein M896_121100 [Ordospora colligata OC4]KHN68888.1 hypothetical protein M896_121100 [Ordospora colligata OC4]TBU13922.1 hypothetical protein CWI40_121100 [Ordospora colligata]TBU14111.1 hypothetical protein CWI41_121100 [Ordospora colligata]TBU17780.1 hypothetical protein CWI42_121100 [Ordospora colligata]
MTAESVTANVERIREMMDGILRDVDGYLERYRSYVMHARGRICRDKQEGEVLLQTVASTLNEMKEKNEMLVSERNTFKAKIEHDTEDMKMSENERHELLNQIKELEMSNLGLSEVAKEKKSMSGALARKMEMVSERKKSRESQMETKVGLFRKCLGMDIVPMKENVIKVVFGRMCADESVECFVMLDLSMDMPVVDMFPRIDSVERMNAMFKTHGNFHDFLSAMRREFRKEYMRMQP